MNNENEKIQPANTMPEGFNGVFNFTNFTDKPFTSKWAGIEYTFPPMSTSPLIIPNATQEEIQNIRKKFAKELALIVYYRSQEFRSLDTVVPGGVPATYTDDHLAQYIQKCLEPLQVAQAIQKAAPKADESVFAKDEEGDNVTKVLDKKKSVIGDGTVVA